MVNNFSENHRESRSYISSLFRDWLTPTMVLPRLSNFTWTLYGHLANNEVVSVMQRFAYRLDKCMYWTAYERQKAGWNWAIRAEALTWKLTWSVPGQRTRQPAAHIAHWRRRFEFQRNAKLHPCLLVPEGTLQNIWKRGKHKLFNSWRNI